MLISIFFIVVLTRITKADSFDEATFNLLVTKLKADAFEFAREVERLYANRCSVDTINSCMNANFGECQSAYPNQECLAGPNYFINVCSSEDSHCSGLWDFSISTVRIPGADADGINGNPTDHKLIEAVCFSRYLDAWFVKKHEADIGYWKSLGVAPRSMYFGSNNGAFRIFPARQSDECGFFDPRIRPWYVAGSSGPKNVVLILDVSGSMNDDNRILLLKQAAKRVVSTLTVSDRVVIVPFSGKVHAPIWENGFVMRATANNKARLSKEIDQLRASGSTNFYDAFKTAFDILDASVDQEYTASCNTAVLFITDGENTDGPGAVEVTSLVDNRITSISAKLRKPILLFTYSVGQNNNVHLYPSELACSVELGVWSKIKSSQEIVDALSSYYRLFALGLGSDSNKDFAAWVEPYQFATGNAEGTTISVPVYDRTKTPPLFLGVVGIDVALEALDAALIIKNQGSSVNSNSETLRAESIKRVVDSSDASCPTKLELSPCELEAYRALSAPGGEGRCEANCTGSQVAQVQEESCPTVSDYPKTLFVDPTISRLSYEERVCCLVGETEASQECYPKDNQVPIGAIVGGVVGGLAAICACIGLYFFIKKRNGGESSALNNAGTANYTKEINTSTDTKNKDNKPKNHKNEVNPMDIYSSPQNPSWAPPIPVAVIESASAPTNYDEIVLVAEPVGAPIAQ